MNKSEVIEYLKQNQDPRGIAHWEKSADNPAGLDSVGIGLTRLRKYAKTIGRDPKLLGKWVRSEDEMRRRCGYGLLYEVSKWKKKSAPDDEAFLACIDRIEKAYARESIPVLMAMGAALMGIGMRNKPLNAAALRVAKKIGPIDFDADGRCDPFDVASKLTGDFVRNKLGL